MMADSASTSSFSFSYGWIYDVFLSFRGKDTRLGFTGYLYKALSDKGIVTFMDDEQLQRGKQITPTLVKVIQHSKIAIVVLSENYASSSFCLDELVNILHCRNSNGALVFPIFYDVDPSDLRHLKGSYGEAVAKHEERFKDKMERLENWKMALQQVANLSGWHFKHGDDYEYKFIGRIVEVVSNKINLPPLHVADHPVGLEFQVLQVNSLLYGGSHDGVRMVGIYGIGGIGKTTIARAVYNLIAHQFDGLCFLEDVRKNSKKHGLVHLQETLLSEIIGEKDIKLVSVSQGISIIQHRLQLKKVLLVLDDVDELKQLKATVGGHDWYGSGSKVIITTRDKHLLTSHGVERTYRVEELNEKEALELLSWNAFKNGEVDPSYLDILSHAATYACGLPLAMEVIGSNLCGKTTEEWKSALDQYERIPDKQIHNILKISFDSLKEHEQKIFLDIACCFKGCDLAYVKEKLYAHHGACPEYGIGVLVEKSLIKINVDGCFTRVTLHDLIEDMGKEIVRLESPEEPGKRSRLWFHEDVQVLEGNMDMNSNLATSLSSLLPSIRPPAFIKKMAHSYDGVIAITAEKDWLIKVQIVRLWVVPSFNGSKIPHSLEMVLIDERGSRIHGSVRKALVYRFQNRLTEGKVIVMTSFGVGSNCGDFRKTRHWYKINFQYNTEVQNLNQLTLNIIPYSFVAFSDILSNDFDQSYLVDVIGVLTGLGTERELEKGGKKTKMNVMELENDGVKIECALFGSYVDDLNGHLASGGGVNSVIVVQFAKVKTFKGKVGLQNAMQCTKLIFNPEIEQAAELKRRVSENSISMSMVLNQLTDSPKLTAKDEWLQLSDRKTLEELKDCTEDCCCVILATIKHLHEGDSWWYLACKCNKSIIEDSKKYYCEICNTHVDDVYQRYRLKCRVIDETDSATFVMFDNVTFTLVGKKCQVLVGGKNKKPHCRPIPNEILGLIDKTCLFKVEVKNVVSSRFQLSYRVKKVTEDAELIKKFQELKVSQNVSGMAGVGCLDPMLQFGESPVDNQLKTGVEIIELGLDTQQFNVGNTSSDGQVARESRKVSLGKRLSDVEVDDLSANSSNRKVMKIIKKEKE